MYKKTRVGRSTISGWGLFLLEDAIKRDFIMEYKGRVKLIMMKITIDDDDNDDDEDNN